MPTYLPGERLTAIRRWRPVRVGERADGKAEILDGLKPGERIVTSGNFLLDSESQLKAASGGTAK